jgi:PiT family inorganic phosphate transporter
MDAALFMLVALIAIALAFDFLNGMNDAANAIATVVSTRVLRPHYAVAAAAFFNFIAFLVFGLHVAETVGRGIVQADIVTERVIFGALIGAITWQIITNRLGIPSSSSHALIGGLVGSGLAKAGVSAVVWGGVFKTVGGIVLAPGLGCGTALLLMLVVSWVFMRFTPYAIDRIFQRVQLFSASCYALGHGGNDAQKTMGIIAVLLYSQGYMNGGFHVPFWVVLSCQAAMAIGTLAGGWRIVKTMGSKITRLTPVQGACAETGGSIMLFAATELGIPVSTTHTITGCIIGVGAAKKVSAVRWGVAREIVTAWIVTIPASAVIAALIYWASGLFAG